MLRECICDWSGEVVMHEMIKDDISKSSGNVVNVMEMLERMFKCSVMEWWCTRFPKVFEILGISQKCIGGCSDEVLCMKCWWMYITLFSKVLRTPNLCTLSNLSLKQTCLVEWGRGMGRLHWCFQAKMECKNMWT